RTTTGAAGERGGAAGAGSGDRAATDLLRGALRSERWLRPFAASDRGERRRDHTGRRRGLLRATLRPRRHDDRRGGRRVGRRRAGRGDATVRRVAPGATDRSGEADLARGA